jgi:parallel beta-helix repeat protein
VVIVCPGTYTEWLAITGARDGLKVRAYSRGTAIIRAPQDLTDGPELEIDGVEDVTIQSLTFTFRSSGCEPRTADVNGMFARNADGIRVLGNTFKATGTETLGPCGFTDGIRIYSTTGARVANNVVRDFKSDGISFERDSRGVVEDNSVQFYHQAATVDDDGDQGIRVVGGARAEVTGNVVRSLSSASEPHLEIGISIQNGAGTSDIHHNDVWYVARGIGVIDSRARVRSNDVRGFGVRHGIHLLDGTGSEVLSNRVRGFDTGIWVEASGNSLRNNDARGNGVVGCLDETSGTGTAGTANTWSGNKGSPASTPVEVCPVP